MQRDSASVSTSQPVQGPSGRPTVSVVIPCYRYGHYLRGAVESVLAQPGVDVDVLVIDDASPDDSGEVAEAIAAADDRVPRDPPPPEPGPHRHLQRGARAWPTGDVRRAAVGRRPDAAGLAGASHGPDGPQPERRVRLRPSPRLPRRRADRPRTTARNWTIWSGHEWIEQRCRRGTQLHPQPRGRDARPRSSDAIGGYDPALPHSGDLEMWLRAAAVADVGRVNGADQGYYRMHAASMQRTVFASPLADCEGRLRRVRHGARTAPTSPFTADEADRLYPPGPRTPSRSTALERRQPGLRRRDAPTSSRSTTTSPSPSSSPRRARRAGPGARSTRRPIGRPGSMPPEPAGHAVDGRCATSSSRLRWRRWRRSGV